MRIFTCRRTEMAANNKMQQSCGSLLVEMESQQPQPADLCRSLGNRMRSLIILILLSAAGELSYASDVFAPKLGKNWVSVETTGIAQKYKDWRFQLWRNKNNGDVLTVATDPFSRHLDSYADLDRAMDFASSAYPEWLNETGFPNWRSEDLNYEPRFLKLQKARLKYRANENAEATEENAIEYCMVNDDDKSPLMANGIVINSNAVTYYVQLTSKRPISDLIPREIVQQLQKHGLQLK